jgi:hypothetical protein
MNKTDLEAFFNLTNFIYSGMLDATHKANAYETKRELLTAFPDLKVIDKAFFAWEIKGADYPTIEDFEYLTEEA